MTVEPREDRIAALWMRTKEHRIAQWTVGYVAVAYGIQHGVTLTADAFDWPHAVARVSMLLLALGLPVAMTVAWYHGERVSRRISGPELAIISILLLMSSALFFVFVQPAGESSLVAREAGVVAARSAAADPHGAISLAVLPFANLSEDKQQEFFSDGMTQEITSALAKIPDLRVVARTSAFQFKGQNKDVQTIARQLRATHIVEGSVRKAGNRVRITAELVKSDDGVSVWTDTYDRELTDVFAIQEEIATAIAASLRMPLGIKPGERLVSSRTKDEATYEDYLRAKALVRGRGIAGLGTATILLEQVTARESTFAPGWALLAMGYSLVPNADRAMKPAVVEETLAKAEAAAERAIKLDPRNPDANATLGLVQHLRRRPFPAADALVKAMALDPANPDSLHLYSSFLADMGYLKQALPLRQQLDALEPFVPVFKLITGRMLYAAGQYEDAIKSGGGAKGYALAAEGRFREAIDWAQALPVGTGLVAKQRPTAMRLLEIAAAATPGQTPSQLTKGLTFEPLVPAWSSFYVYVGAPEHVLDGYDDALRNGYLGPGDNEYLWAPIAAPVRNSARFKAYARKLGMVDYWRKNGWPDLCHPVGADDFACN